MNGSATSSMRIVVMSRVSQPILLEGVLQRQAVDHGGGHAHVVGGRFLDDVGAAAELRPRGGCCRRRRRSRARRRAPPRATAWRAIRLTSSTLMPPSPGPAEALARELEQDAAEDRRSGGRRWRP